MKFQEKALMYIEAMTRVVVVVLAILGWRQDKFIYCIAHSKQNVSEFMIHEPKKAQKMRFVF